MADDVKSMFPSMTPQEPGEGLEGMFNKSGSMFEAKARNEEIAAQEQARRDTHQREMENIKQHGPLERTSERILNPEEQAALEEEAETGRKPLDPDEEGIQALVEAGDFDALADRIREDFVEMGAGQADLAMVDYYADIVKSTDDPAWKKWAADMAVWTRKTLKARGGA